jgi:hypothetical protein|tara:strand:+ start:198 stop:404 length:207 start_codon:yes stop_codon:yes gene_type:complete
MKVGDLIRDLSIHQIRSPDGAASNRLGVIRAINRSRYEIAWIDKGDDRYVNKRDLEVISGSQCGGVNQ